jgi:hypothetical protein
MRPEIEEDYRQLKDFWQLEDFKSTKLLLVAFHMVCTFLGYLMRDGNSGQKRGLVFDEEQAECMEELLPRFEGKTEKQKNP